MAMTRGTANSCFDNNEMTRLSSSSPVAAMATSTLAKPAASSELTSQPSAATRFTRARERSRLHQVDVLVDQKDVVSLRSEICGDRSADVPCSANCDLHRRRVPTRVTAGGGHSPDWRRVRQSSSSRRCAGRPLPDRGGSPTSSRGSPALLSDDQASLAAVDQLADLLAPPTSRGSAAPGA